MNTIKDFTPFGMFFLGEEPVSAHKRFNGENNGKW